MQQTPTNIDDRIYLRDLTVAEFLALLASVRTNANPPPKPLYTIAETARLLDCTDRQVRRLLAKDMLEKRKVAHRGSSKVLIPWESIEKLLGSGA